MQFKRQKFFKTLKHYLNKCPHSFKKNLLSVCSVPTIMPGLGNVWANKVFHFIYFWLCCVFIPACTLFSSCCQQRLLSSCSGWASHCSGFSCCRAQALGHGFSSWGTRAPRHMESSQTRDQNCVPVLASGLPTTGPPWKSTNETVLIYCLAKPQETELHRALTSMLAIYQALYTLYLDKLHTVLWTLSSFYRWRNWSTEGYK